MPSPTRRLILASLGAAALGLHMPGAALAQSARLQSWPLNTPDRTVRTFPLPEGSPYANLNTAAFDGGGDLWFTGQSGVVGKVNVKTGAVSEWDSGNLSMHDPAAKTAAQAWRTWRLPGAAPRCYAVYVDDRDMVWTSDFGANAVFRFDPAGERFERFGFPREATNIRQILGRPSEVWLPESGTEHLSVIRTT